MGERGSDRRRGSRLLATAASCLAVLSFGFGGHGAKPVSASKWVTAVCTAENTLKSSVASQFSAFQAATSGNTFDPATVKSTLLNLLQAATPAAQTLVSQLEAAGVPKITNGKKIAQLYVSTAQSLAGAFAADQPQVTALPTSDVTAFKAALNPIISPLQSTTQRADQQVKKLLKDKKVDKALGDCGGVFALGNGRGANAPATTPSPGAAGSAPPGGTPGGATGGGGPPAGGPAGGAAPAS